MKLVFFLVILDMDSSDSRYSPLRAVKADVLKFIQNKVFLGRYTERRYVESLQAYRYCRVILLY